jgi:signal transduction histidine kinase
MPVRLRELLDALLSHASGDYSRSEVLRQICTSLLRFSGSDMVSIRIDEDGRATRSSAVLMEDGSDRVHTHVFHGPSQGSGSRDAGADPVPEPILQAIMSGSIAAPIEYCTRGGSFWIGDAARPILLRELRDRDPAGRTVVIGGDFPSLALVPIRVVDRSRGVLCLASRRRDFFTGDDVQVYEAVAQTLGVALAHQGAQWALRERVKELTCLYEIAKLAQRPGMSLETLLGRIVSLLPPAWQYPELTSARIVLDGHHFATDGLKDGPYRQSAAIVANDRPRGIVEVFYTEEMPEIDEGPFLKEERHLINAVAETIGGLVAHHEAQWALRERVKELTCLYGIAKVAGRPGIRPDDFLTEIVGLLPPGWQYPEITQSRITLDGRSFATARFRDSSWRQSADIRVNDLSRGVVEVVYTERMPDIDEGPFLKEERSLINEIARQVAVTVEHWETEAEASRLQEQLRHADRLATIGQLSAGVAHELNEPLGAVLGFAELVKQSPELSARVAGDVDRIIKAALHAREIIRKLMIFTRQMPTRKTTCDLNHIVGEGLYFLESRCAKEGIALVRRLEEGLPPVMADPSQLQQVLVNLIVNAIQAMPGGGTLTITTRSGSGNVYLNVEDTGIGMGPDVQSRLFVPFFTTKEVGQGTGLGLPVVHGIVTAHGGTVHVKSEPGKGSSFEISLPIEDSQRADEGR